METIKKHSETEVEIVKAGDVVSLTDLKKTLEEAHLALDDWESWVAEEREARREIINKLEVQIQNAVVLGIKEDTTAITSNP